MSCDWILCTVIYGYNFSFTKLFTRAANDVSEFEAEAGLMAAACVPYVYKLMDLIQRDKMPLTVTSLSRTTHVKAWTCACLHVHNLDI